MPIRAFLNDDGDGVDRRFRWRWMQENMPIGRQRGERLQGTRRLRNGLWHHHLVRAHRSKKKHRVRIRMYHRHLISRSENPNRGGIAHLCGWVGISGTFRVDAAMVRPSCRGLGYGKIAYRECLRVHGRLRSDKIVSREAEAVYRWFAKQKRYRVRLGRPNDRNSRHTIELKSWRKKK